MVAPAGTCTGAQRGTLKPEPVLTYPYPAETRLKVSSSPSSADINAATGIVS